jgi:phage host-nuclease inhibitor protein Gam
MATAKRVTKVVVKNVSLDDAQQASAEYASVQTKLELIEAKMNQDINKVKDKYKEEITELQDKLVKPREILEVFAKEQQPSWGKKKSMELVHTIIGFRTGQPKVTKDKKFTWEGVLELMKKNRAFKGFVRVSEEVNKEAILQEKNEAVLNQLKEECYVSIEQDEKVYVEVKKEEVAA